MAFQDFRDQQTAQIWDADTLSYNPSRPEQLDMLLTLLEAEYQPGKTVLDLGMGSGLVEEMLFKRVTEAQVVGVDASQAMLKLAHERLKPFASQYVTLEHDFAHLETLELPERDYQFVISIQALHHLNDEQMQTAYAIIYRLLDAGGLFLLLDRIAVDQPGLFACYQTMWQRQDRLHNSKVSQGERDTFAAHQQVVRERGDLPMALERHLELMKAAGFEAGCLHLHTNRALFAARKV